MDLMEVMQRRYATKKFDPTKRILDSDFEQIKTLLRFSPSSVNSQPWHFIIAQTPQAKKRISKGTQGVYIANEAKVLDASHVILFCSKTDMSDEYLSDLLESEDKSGRFTQPESKQSVQKVRAFYADLHRVTLDDTQAWMEKQVYLNMGTVLLGAGMLGIDAVPIEGLDIAQLNQEFELTEKGLTAVAVIALGYRDKDDFNADLPKSRWSADKTMLIL